MQIFPDLEQACTKRDNSAKIIIKTVFRTKVWKEGERELLRFVGAGKEEIDCSIHNAKGLRDYREFIQDPFAPRDF